MDTQALSAEAHQTLLAMRIADVTFVGTKATQTGGRNLVIADYMKVIGNVFDKRKYPHTNECDWLVEEKKRLLQTITVGDFITAYGEWPRVPYYDDHSQNTHKGMKYLRQALALLGMTSQEWFLMEPLQEDVFALHVKRCAGDKDQLKLLSMLILGFPCIVVNALQVMYYPHTNVEHMPLYEMTVGDVLTIAFPESLFQRPAVLSTARARLRAMGFSEEDGPFLKEAQEEKKQRNNLWRTTERNRV